MWSYPQPILALRPEIYDSQRKIIERMSHQPRTITPIAVPGILTRIAALAYPVIRY